MANGTTNGSPNGRAWYLEAFKLVGFPVAIVVFWLAQDANYLPSNSRESLAIVRQAEKDLAKVIQTQDLYKDTILAELRALRRRQAALCLIMLTSFSNAAKDINAVRDACVAEAMQGTP